MRIIIDLEDAQASRLDAWAKAQKVSRAVNQMLDRAAQPQGTGFGLWALAKQCHPSAMAWHYNASCGTSGPHDCAV